MFSFLVLVQAGLTYNLVSLDCTRVWVFFLTFFNFLNLYSCTGSHFPVLPHTSHMMVRPKINGYSPGIHTNLCSCWYFCDLFNPVVLCSHVEKCKTTDEGPVTIATFPDLWIIDNVCPKHILYGWGNLGDKRKHFPLSHRASGAINYALPYLDQITIQGGYQVTLSPFKAFAGIKLQVCIFPPPAQGPSKALLERLLAMVQNSPCAIQGKTVPWSAWSKKWEWQLWAVSLIWKLSNLVFPE